MPIRESIKRLLRMCGDAFNAGVQDRLSALERELRNRSQPDAPPPAPNHLNEQLEADLRDFLTHQIARQVCVETSDYAANNPEVGLMEFLYSHLPIRTALDIGAHSGEVSEHLLSAGFEVYAFEPFPESYARMTGRLAHFKEFHAFPFALGNTSGEGTLHLAADSTLTHEFEDTSVFHSLTQHPMPEGLSFCDSIRVETRRLADLADQGIIPPDVGLVKIDTEGHDLEVIRGMGDRRYPVVLTEFWDAAVPFASPGHIYQLGEMVREMRSRNYFWFLVIYHVWGQEHTGFFANHDRPVPKSWGNIFFFQDREIFAQAQQWCSAVLPRAYFKPAPKPVKAT